MLRASVACLPHWWASFGLGDWGRVPKGIPIIRYDLVVTTRLTSAFSSSVDFPTTFPLSIRCQAMSLGWGDVSVSW